ncbi:hypothetical protein ABPG75_003146 [Micractinium tetrahymenae]
MLEPTTGDTCLARLMGALDPALDELEEAAARCKQAATFLSAAESFAGLPLSLQRLEAARHELLPGSPPLPSVAQLRCACLGNVLHLTQGLGFRMVKRGDASLSSAKQALLPLVEGTAEEALQLAPDSPKLHFLVGEAMVMLEMHQLGLNNQLRCLELAPQQGSDFNVARAALGAAVLAGLRLTDAGVDAATIGIELGTAEAALAAFPLAEPALQRCRRLLPQYWVAGLEEMLAVARPAMKTSMVWLRALQAQGSAATRRRRHGARQRGTATPCARRCRAWRCMPRALWKR